MESYRKAAEQRDATARKNLASTYLYGQGVPQDYSEALNWYRRAAEQGSANAQSGLAWMYDKGEGVPKDYVQAYAWYHLAAASDMEESMEAERNLRKKLTPEQIVAAEELSTELFEKIQARLESNEAEK